MGEGPLSIQVCVYLIMYAYLLCVCVHMYILQLYHETPTMEKFSECPLHGTGYENQNSSL